MRTPEEIERALKHVRECPIEEAGSIRNLLEWVKGEDNEFADLLTALERVDSMSQEQIDKALDEIKQDGPIKSWSA